MFWPFRNRFYVLFSIELSGKNFQGKKLKLIPRPLFKRIIWTLLFHRAIRDMTDKKEEPKNESAFVRRYSQIDIISAL